MFVVIKLMLIEFEVLYKITNIQQVGAQEKDLKLNRINRENVQILLLF
jgi:hypothetical protein